MKTSTTITLPEQGLRNPVLVALMKRHGSTTTVMKDRRAPRGGCRNKQREYREERY